MTRRLRTGTFVLAGLALTALLALLVSPLASSSPDGLERVATDQGFADRATPHTMEGLPTAGYGVRGIGDERLSTGVAGLLGVGVTFLVGGGIAVGLRRARAR